MTNRSLVRTSQVLLAALVIGGCSDSGPTEAGPYLEVMPRFTGIAEGDSLKLTATYGGEPTEVTWESSEPNAFTVSGSGWVHALAGGQGAVTATLVSNPSIRRSTSITVIPIPVVTSGTPVTGLGGATGSQSFYKIAVPAGATNLTVTVSGGTGDVDLYLRQGSRPTTSTFACRSWNAGNGESCSINNPTAGTWFILLDVWSAYSGATLTATITN